MEKKKKYTVSIYAENNIGLLNRISSIFLKRHISIDSVNSSPSEINDIYRFVIVVTVHELLIKKVITQIENRLKLLQLFIILIKKLFFRSPLFIKLNLNHFLKKGIYKI